MATRGWALAEQGQSIAGIVQIREGLAAYRATGAEADRAYFLALLAEAYGRGKRNDEGLAGAGGGTRFDGPPRIRYMGS